MAGIPLYVVRSIESGRRYIGITNDLPRRLEEHRKDRGKSGQILEEFRLLHTEEYPDYSTARIREKFLKTGKGRDWLNEKFRSGS